MDDHASALKNTEQEKKCIGGIRMMEYGTYPRPASDAERQGRPLHVAVVC